MNIVLKPPSRRYAYTLHERQKASKTKTSSSEDAASGGTLEYKGKLLAIKILTSRSDWVMQFYPRLVRGLDSKLNRVTLSGK